MNQQIFSLTDYSHILISKTKQALYLETTTDDQHLKVHESALEQQFSWNNLAYIRSCVICSICSPTRRQRPTYWTSIFCSTVSFMKRVCDVHGLPPVLGNRVTAHRYNGPLKFSPYFYKNLSPARKNCETHCEWKSFTSPPFIKWTMHNTASQTNEMKWKWSKLTHSSHLPSLNQMCFGRVIEDSKLWSVSFPWLWEFSESYCFSCFFVCLYWQTLVYVDVRERPGALCFCVFALSQSREPDVSVRHWGIS